MSQADIDRGTKADVWLNDPEFLASFDAVEEQIMTRFGDAKNSDVETLVECKALLTALRMLKGYFVSSAQTGRYELSKLQR